MSQHPNSSMCPSQDLGNLTHLLNTREMKQKELYEETYKTRYGRTASCDPDLVCHLGDNVKFTLSWSAASQSLPTLRRSSGKLWIPYLSRWMVPRERLASLAFPVTQGSADVLGVPPCLSSMSIEQKLFAEMP